jgi:hypothetical protein
MTVDNILKKERGYDLIFSVRKLVKLTECQFSIAVTVHVREKRKSVKKVGRGRGGV